MNKTLTIILGPTAVGKTSYSIAQAQKIGCPIINCDSRQIFKELNVGVARPSEDELSLVKHYFIGTHSVQDNYTAGKFEIEALDLLSELFKYHDQLIMVGGSGFYIDALCFGLDDFPDADLDVRTTLMTRLEQEGLLSLQEELKKIDPESYHSIDLANKQRVIRALEVTIATGKPFSQWKTSPKKERFFDIKKIGLTLPREILYDRINARVDIMMQNGLLEEAKSLIGYRDLPALKTVGYRELFDYLDGKIPLEEAIRLIKRNTRHYAKRQMTYWSRDKEIEWINSLVQIGT